MLLELFGFYASECIRIPNLDILVLSWTPWKLYYLLHLSDCHFCICSQDTINAALLPSMHIFLPYVSYALIYMYVCAYVCLYLYMYVCTVLEMKNFTKRPWYWSNQRTMEMSKLKHLI